MKPDLEVVQIGQGWFFKDWEHGYPKHTACSHFHPAIEVPDVVATKGRQHVGCFIVEC